MRDVTEAHFLHQRSGLEAVLRAPVAQPAALAWIPGREELLVAGRDGGLHVVDPVLGTRVIAGELGVAVALAVHPDRQRFVVVTREGEWILGRLHGGIDFRGRHEFTGAAEAFFAGDHAVMAGDVAQGRVMIAVADGAVKGVVNLPERVLPVSDDDGKLLLARSTASGLQVIRFRKNARFPDGAPTTGPRLKTCGKFILGLTLTGVCVWEKTGGGPRSMRLPDLTAGDVSPDGKFLGLGTRAGAVALAALDRLDTRAKPHLVKAFEQPVTSCAFSDRGRWLATGGEGLQIWTWED
jgi:hypothetical protein